MVSLTGAVAAYRKTVCTKVNLIQFILNYICNSILSLLDCKIDESYRDVSRYNDPIVLNGKTIAQRIKATLGITG